MTEVVNDSSEPEDAGVVKKESSNPSNVDATNSIALVHKRLVTKRRHRKSFLHVTGDNPCEEKLVDNETCVDFPRVEVGRSTLKHDERRVEHEMGTTYLANMVPHTP